MPGQNRSKEDLAISNIVWAYYQGLIDTGQLLHALDKLPHSLKEKK